MQNILNKDKYQDVIEKLKLIMQLYRYVLEMDLELQERIILNQILKQGRGYLITEACESVLKQYADTFPDDSTLIDEVKNRLPIDLHVLFPNDIFDRSMLVYRGFDSLIHKLFLTIQMDEYSHAEQYRLQHLQRVVHNSLVNNPNFKGESPCYKRNHKELDRSITLTLKLMDDDFNSEIKYFKEMIEERKL